MPKHHPKNERVKRRYAQYLEQALGQTAASVDKALAAIARFEDSTRWKAFDAFHIEQAVAFKERLDREINPATGRPLAKSTTASTLQPLRAFFRWLSQQDGYRKRIRATDADYFNPSNRDRQIARAADQRPAPSLAQIRHVVAAMPAETAVQRRDRAILAFLILTGIRDGAAIGLKLRHVDLAERRVCQDAREIRTKFSKTMWTDFFPVGQEIEAIFVDYLRSLQEEQLFSDDDPLFPATRMGSGPNGGFVVTGLTR